MADIDLTTKRLIFDSFCSTDPGYFVNAVIQNNRLFISVSDVNADTSHDFEVVLKPVESNKEPEAPVESVMYGGPCVFNNKDFGVLVAKSNKEKR